MVALGAVLEQFPDDVIIYITDPRTGIQRRSKWPPTISEVIEAAEQHQDHLTRIRAPRRPAALGLPAPDETKTRPQGYMAQVFVPDGHERYAKLLVWTENADPRFWKFGQSSDRRNGLWVSWSAWTGEDR